MSDFKEIPGVAHPPEAIPANSKPVSFDDFFQVDNEKDLQDIKGVLGRVKKDRRYEDPIASTWEIDRLRKYEGLQYSESDLEEGSWTEEDFELAKKGLREEKIDKYFTDLAYEYEQVNPIPDSIVRLDQEATIAEDLDNNIPVLIRGAWRLGKTSMLRSLETHRFGQRNTMFFDVVGYDPGKDATLEQFRKDFGLYPISSFIAEREIARDDFQKRHERRDEIIEEVRASGEQPFEYLDRYLTEKGESIFLAMDEAILYGGKIDFLKHIAELKKFKNIKLGIVMHRNAAAEENIAEAFEDFQTHFIRALTEEEVGILVRKPIEGSHIIFSDEAIAEMHRFSGGRPMEINNLCHALLHPHPDSVRKNFSQQKFNFDVDDVKKVTEADIWDLISSSGPFQHAVSNYRRVYEIMLSDDEREIVDRLVKKDIPISELDESVMSPLVDTTYVIRDEEAGVYRANGSLFVKVISSI